jgi:hypothetical protein
MHFKYVIYQLRTDRLDSDDYNESFNLRELYLGPGNNGFDSIGLALDALDAYKNSNEYFLFCDECVILPKVRV